MSEQDKISRRSVLGKIGAFLGAVGASGLAGCASRPEGRGVPGQYPYGTDGQRVYRLVRYNPQYIVIVDQRGVQYRVTVWTPQTRGNPQMDCGPTPPRQTRPGFFPGLFNGVLDGMHEATNNFRLWSCGAYARVTEPFVRTTQQSVDNLIAELNNWELDPRIYGSRDASGQVYRAAEDPNRIIVVEPFFIRRSMAPVQEQPSLARRLLARSTTPRPKDLA